VGPVLVVRGIRALRADSAFQRRAYRAQGIVTEIRRDHRGERPSSYPVVRFNLPDGRTVEASATKGAGPGSAREGAPVNVLYDPENPTDIRIEGFLGSGTMAGVVAIVMGVTFFVMGVLIGSIFALVR
jgi:hypothetical protein